jgi:hypothetical protein
MHGYQPWPTRLVLLLLPLLGLPSTLLPAPRPEPISFEPDTRPPCAPPSLLPAAAPLPSPDALGDTCSAGSLPVLLLPPLLLGLPPPLPPLPASPLTARLAGRGSAPRPAVLLGTVLAVLLSPRAELLTAEDDPCATAVLLEELLPPSPGRTSGPSVPPSPPPACSLLRELHIADDVTGTAAVALPAPNPPMPALLLLPGLCPWCDAALRVAADVLEELSVVRAPMP